MGAKAWATSSIKDRKPKYMHLGLSINDKHWDETTGKVHKSHPNAVRLNNLILKKLAEANNTAIELDTREEFVSSEEIMGYYSK
ncbi:MAG: Arm DNA-binding domain-containing protein [Cytophagales bacterium]|nr:Arm DNA-binding domain-containing protein [Cytophagales bacterium]